jgi:hypothetical protein
VTPPLLSHDTGLRLLENATAAAGLFAITLMFGPISGGHFNPVVSLVDAAFGGLSRRDALACAGRRRAGLRARVGPLPRRGGGHGGRRRATA